MPTPALSVGHYENFPVASRIIHPRHRALILAFYNFVRTADDIADHATLGASDKLAYLDLLEAELLGQGDSQPEAVQVDGLSPWTSSMNRPTGMAEYRQ